MLPVKRNFKEHYITDIKCEVCKREGKDNEDTQKHILTCKVTEDEIVLELPKYEDIFSVNLNNQVKILKIFRQKYISRVKLLKDLLLQEGVDQEIQGIAISWDP